MTTADLVSWFENEFFKNESVQKDLDSELGSFFNDDDKSNIIDNAIKQGDKKWTRSLEGLQNIKPVWENVLNNEKGGDIDVLISENQNKSIPELDKVTGLSSEAQNRVDNRLTELIDKAEPEELVTLTAKEELSAKSQEDVNVELGEDINKFSREQLLDLNITNKGLKSVANRILKIPQSDLQNALESKGFVIDAKNIIRKGG